MSKRLGRGLDALIPTLNINEDDQVIQIPLSQLRVNPYQPRKHFDDQAIDELAQSIQEHGVIQPIIVRRSIKDYEIIAGERRFRASQKSNLQSIPAVVKQFTDRQVMEIALIENIQREDLNALELAQAYQKLIEEFNITQEQLALRVGKSRPHITNFLRLLQLPVKVQENVSRGTLSMGHARALLALKKQEEIVAFAVRTIEANWSVRQLEEAIQQHQQKNTQKSKSKPKHHANPFFMDYADRLRESLGTPVQIKHNQKEKGKIEIEFYSKEDLVRIMDLIKHS